MKMRNCRGLDDNVLLKRFLWRKLDKAGTNYSSWILYPHRCVVHVTLLKHFALAASSELREVRLHEYSCTRRFAHFSFSLLVYDHPYGTAWKSYHKRATPSLKHQTNSSTSGSHLLQGRSAASNAINVRQRMSVSFVRKTELAHATLALCLRGLD
mmetsp:Transcript_5687/g.22384  ORF Transcript_5687/g.22384 Transcript_5687/m.22384 type:complete len:155 (-) Transcript_5687:3210-3674(-)